MELTTEQLNGWKLGPLPQETWNWGGVVLWGPDGTTGTGFYFADFHGDHVMVHSGDKPVKHFPHEVALYNDSLRLPPKIAETKSSLDQDQPLTIPKEEG